MRILFFTLKKIISLNDKNIYSDMINEFIKRGHKVDYYFPNEKEFILNNDNFSLNSILIKNKIQKTKNFSLKLFSYILLEFKFVNIILKTKNNYDLLVIVTPSIFQTKIIKTFKNRFPNSKTLLLLKDIFPDNALNLGILNMHFPFIFLYKYFRSIEKKLYNLIDKIGVMTELNRTYILSKYPNLVNKIFISYNSIKFYEIKKNKLRSDLGLPDDKIILIFIGNLGLPQDPLLFKKLIMNSPKNIFYAVIGVGSQEVELSKINSKNFLFINKLFDQDTIDQYLINSDYGLVLLNSKFKVPNFPSKITSYLNANLPLIAITNEFNDLKNLIETKLIVGKWFHNIPINFLKIIEFLRNLSPKQNLSNHQVLNLYNVEEQIEEIFKNIE